MSIWNEVVYNFQITFTSQNRGGGWGRDQLKLENKKQEIKLQKDYNHIHDLNYYAQTKTCPSSFKNIHQGEKSLWWYFIHHCKGSYFWQAIWNKILSFMKAEILLKSKKTKNWSALRGLFILKGKQFYIFLSPEIFSILNFFFFFNAIPENGLDLSVRM